MNILKYSCLSVIFAVVLMVAAGSSNSAESDEKSPPPTVTISTDYGDIYIKLRPDIAPNHVKNFLKLVRAGFYDGTTFHKILPGYLIQGGDPNTKGLDVKSYGLGGPGYIIEPELSNVQHIRGTVSMARNDEDEPESSGSQFFIVVQDARFLSTRHTIFGEVISGIDVADKIVSLKYDEENMLTERVKMTVKVDELAAPDSNNRQPLATR